jgi:hypothetical protein
MHTPTNLDMKTQRRSSVARMLGWSTAAVVLALVFAAYLRPDVALTLATQLWNCF